MTIKTEKLIGGHVRVVASNWPEGRMTPGGPRALPAPRKLTLRRFLPVMGASASAAEFYWIDDDGHEHEQHLHGDGGALMWSKWHRFEDAAGKLYLIRCPATLEEDEKLRVMADLPEGSIREKLQFYAKEHREARGKKATDRKSDDAAVRRWQE